MDAPFDQEKVYDPDGFTVRLILPLAWPQFAFMVVVVSIGEMTLSPTVNDATLLHEAASVTVTLYVPDVRLLISSDDAPLDQEKV